MSATPAIYNYAALIGTCFVILLVFSPRIELPYKPLIALAVVATPIEGREVFMCLTNTQWILALGAVLIAISDAPRTTRGKLFDAIALAGIGLTGPFVLAFLPLFAFRAYHRRDRYDLVLLGVAAVCGLVQLYNLTEANIAPHPDSKLTDLIYLLARFFGFPFAAQHARAYPPQLALAWLISSAAILSYGFMIYRAITLRAYTTLTILAAGLLILGSTLLKYSLALHLLYDAGPRYYYIPTICFVWALLSLLPRSRILPSFLLLTMSFSTLTINDMYRETPLVNYHWRKWTRCIRREPHCRIPINPEGWYVEVEGKRLWRKRRKLRKATS